MLCVALRLCDQVVETHQHDVSKITEVVHHGALEGGSNIFEAKGHDSVSEGAPWSCECHFAMVFFSDLDLVVSKKTVHEGEGLMSGACIDYLVDEWCGGVVFGTCPIEIVKVCANVNGTLFFIHGNRIRNPSGVCNGVNEASCAQLLYLGFDHGIFGGMDGPLLLAHRGHIRPCVDVVFQN